MDDRVILAVSDDFLPAATGVGMHMQTVYRELAKKGFKIVVMTSRQKDQSSYEKWNGVDVYRYKSICIAGFYQALPTAPQIKKLIRDNNIGLVHFHYLSTMTLQVNKLCKRLRIPKIYTYHMTEDHLTQPLFMRPFRGLIRAGIVRLCNSMDLVIFPSQKLMDSASNRGVKKPCLYLTNPLVPDLFNPPLHVNGITDTAAFNILFAGRLNAEKNVPLLLKAFALHMTAFPDSRLWIAGEGTSKSALKKLCDELGIAAHVNFLGFLSHEVLATYYQACQVFVLPSFVETQGIVAMEAMRLKNL
jgi:1,2-diacylglycerol 3-alpha-glucosyltransferase